MKKYRIYLIAVLTVIAFLITLCFIPIGVSKFIPTVEEQVSKDLGLNIHIEKLILRVGPLIKVKAPIMHVMYEDGQKFAQLDNVKFYIPWNSLWKTNPSITLVDAKKLTVRVNSNDKYLPILLETLQKKEFSEIPNFKLKEYNCTYFNKENSDKYTFIGQNFDLEKLVAYRNLKIKAAGDFSINNQKYISYDIVFTPNIELDDLKANYNVPNLIDQMKELDFHSDIIADVKLYKNTNKNIQASGFINIDNISVLDKSKKNPKSFVYLTLWGDKASILSNIYTSVNKKVYIEGMINNSKKPILDIKVKTDEIDISDLYKKLKIFTDISDIKQIASIGGTLNANFSLKGDLNKIKSAGYLKIKDAYINADGLQINKINSDIDFSNNIINIVKAVGYVKNEPIIAKGTIAKNINIELLMSKVDLKYLCPASYGVKGGIASLIANITGTLDNITHKENLLIENLKLENANFDLFVESFKIDTNKNNTAYINNIICKTPKTAQIKLPSLKMLDSSSVTL